jgi:hypothetical protein
MTARDDVRACADRYMPFGDFNEPIGVTAQLAPAEGYRADARSATYAARAASQGRRSSSPSAARCACARTE